jgi:predicted DNA-binding protein (MmcQ/YjbR family)
MADDPAYTRFKQLCLTLPRTKVTMTWGAPHMRVGDKIFTGWGLDDGGKTWSFSAKLDKDKQAALVASDPRFTVAPYVGKHGWVSVQIKKGKENWGEIAALVEESYRNVATKTRTTKRAKKKP